MAQIMRNDDYLTPEELTKQKYLNAVNNNLASMPKTQQVVANSTAATQNLFDKPQLVQANNQSNIAADIYKNSGFSNLENAINNPGTASNLIAKQDSNNTETVTGGGISNNTNNGFDVAAYIRQMAEAKKAQGMADKLNAYNTNLAGLNAQKEGLAPKYYNERNNQSVQSQMQARNFAEYMANRGLTNSGTNAQAELARNLGLQGNIGALNRQQLTDENNIETQKNNLGIAYNNDIASLNAGIDADTMGRLIDQYNSDRSRNDSLDQFAKQYGLNLAGFTGIINGQNTMQKTAADIANYGNILNNEAQAITNQYLPLIQQGQVDANTLQNAYQSMVNSNYPKEEAAKIAGILASNKGITLDNDAKAIANKYAPQIVQGQIDGQKLQNAYQKLVNAGYDKQVAADLASKYANIAQGNAQIAISQQNANTNSAQQDWAENPNNPLNISRLDKGSPKTMTQTQIGNAKTAIAKEIEAVSGTVPTKEEIDKVFTERYGTPTVTQSNNTTLPQAYTPASQITDAKARQQWYNDNKSEIDKSMTKDQLSAFKTKFGLK